MTLEEAIKHCEEKAKELSDKAYEEWGKGMTEEQAYDCNECAREHAQLVEWLTHYDDICTIIDDYKAEIAEAEGESAFTRECIRKRAFAKILDLFGGDEE